MSSFVILSHNGKKLVEGQLWAEVIQVMIWSHVKVYLSCPELYELIFFLWVTYFILLLLCARIDEGS